jgi:hypothetical protein
MTRQLVRMAAGRRLAIIGNLIDRITGARNRGGSAKPKAPTPA